jgi:hypothetical protein
VSSQQVERAPVARAGTFDLAGWRPERARLLAAASVAVFAAAAWAQGSIWRLAAGLLLLDLGIQLLPWRLPRKERHVASVCVEEIAYLVVPTAFFAVALARGETWATALPAPWWFAVAVAVGAGLVLLGGLSIRLLLSGTLGCLAPPLRRPHKWARAFNAAVAPPGEEAVFRGIALAASGGAAVPLGLLGGVAFVARHHLPPGASARTPRRVLVTQSAAALALLGLTLASGSIFPALLAHYVNNAPSLVLEVQRRTQEG